MLDILTPLYVFDVSTVTAQRYRDEILELHFRLLWEVANSDFIFIYGNMKLYKTQIANDFLDEENIRHIDLPAMSLGVNPNEPIVWDALDH